VVDRSRRHWLQAIKPLLQPALPLTLRVNPAEGAKVKIPKTRGWHTWTDEEIAQCRTIGRSVPSSGSSWNSP
jgi:hypothetical protein